MTLSTAIDKLTEPRAVSVRTLGNVLLDIAEQNAANAKCYRMAAAAWAARNTAEEDRQGDIGAAIEQRLSDLHGEARAMIHEATGVTWEQLYEALA